MGLFDKLKQLTNEVTTNVKNEFKPQIIKQATNINYGAISNFLQTNNLGVSVNESVIISIDLLQKAANDYNNSLEENKDEKFLSCIIDNIDADFILASIKPISNFIPGGKVLIFLLELVIKSKKIDKPKPLKSRQKIEKI